MKKSLVIVIVIVLVVASGGLVYWFAIRKPKKTDTTSENKPSDSKATSFAPIVQSQNTGNKIVDDLKLMQKGIEAYLAKYGEYPNTAGKWIGYGIKAGDYSQTREKNWFPEIAEFIGDVPTMNKTNPNETEQAYMYNSNGFDYKLIAHLPPQKTIELVKNTYPDLVDPVRTGWAIAIYTEGSKTA